MKLFYRSLLFVSYLPCIKLADGVPVTINLKEENQFKLQPEELLAAITDKTKILILSYPNNPTGAIMTREDLEPIAEIIKEKDLYVISDEIYAELTYGQDHCSIASLPGMRDRTIIINGFSKSFAMTGWRMGFATGGTDHAANIKNSSVCDHGSTDNKSVCCNRGNDKRRRRRTDYAECI